MASIPTPPLPHRKSQGRATRACPPPAFERIQRFNYRPPLLKGLLPTCAWYKKVRDDKGYWQQIETYVYEHSEVDFLHDLCPDCLKKHFSEYAWKMK